MKRREFFKGAGLGALALGGCSAAPAGPASGKRALMKLGTQQASPTDDMLRYLAQFGVRNICGTPPRPGLKGSWEVDDLLKLRERVELFGIKLDLLPLPMSAWPISRSESPHIMLGKSPERDREIEILCDDIRAAAKAGIPAVKYNLTFLGVVRTERTLGRGGSSYSTFDVEKSRVKDQLTEAGRVGADEVWQRITYFLDRVVPVAEECKVRIACHPNDPRLPDGFRGVDYVSAPSTELRDSSRSIQPVPAELRQERSRRGWKPAKSLRRHPLLRDQEDLQRPLPEHQGPVSEVPGDVSRRRRRGHAQAMRSQGVNFDLMMMPTTCPRRSATSFARVRLHPRPHPGRTRG
jgi:hypothetical protein